MLTDRTRTESKILRTVVWVAGFFAVLLSAPCAVADETLPALTLTEAVRQTVERYPQVQAEEYNLRSSRAAKRQALSGYLPSVGTDFSMNQGDDPVYVFGSLLKQQKFTQDNFALPALNEPSPYMNYQTGVEISMPVFSGLQTEGRIRSANWSVKASESLKENAVQEAAFTAVHHYVRLLSLGKLSELTQQAVSLAEESLKEADSLKERGMVLGCDYSTAKAILLQMKEGQERIKYQEHAAKQSLNILMGNVPDNPIALASFSSPEAFPEISAEDFKKSSRELRKDREAARYRVKMAQSDLEREGHSRLPKIDAFARGESNANDFSSNANIYLFGVRLRMDIFEPRLPAKIDQIAAEKGRLQSMADQLNDVLDNSLAETIAEYNAQNSILELAAQSMKDSREAEQAITELYRAGKRTIADVLKAQSYKLSLETSYWQARYRAFLSYANLYFLSGKLSEKSIGDLEAMLTASRE